MPIYVPRGANIRLPTSHGTSNLVPTCRTLLVPDPTALPAQKVSDGLGHSLQKMPPDYQHTFQHMACSKDNPNLTSPCCLYISQSYVFCNMIGVEYPTISGILVTMRVGKHLGLRCFASAFRVSNSSFLTNLKPSSANRHSSVASTTKSGSSCLFTSCTCTQTWTCFANANATHSYRTLGLCCNGQWPIPPLPLPLPLPLPQPQAAWPGIAC